MSLFGDEISPRRGWCETLGHRNQMKPTHLYPELHVFWSKHWMMVSHEEHPDKDLFLTTRFFPWKASWPKMGFPVQTLLLWDPLESIGIHCPLSSMVISGWNPHWTIEFKAAGKTSKIGDVGKWSYEIFLLSQSIPNNHHHSKEGFLVRPKENVALTHPVKLITIAVGAPYPNVWRYWSVA